MIVFSGIVEIKCNTGLSRSPPVVQLCQLQSISSRKKSINPLKPTSVGILVRITLFEETVKFATRQLFQALFYKFFNFLQTRILTGSKHASCRQFYGVNYTRIDMYKMY